jgi:hypothetical protein
MNTRRLLLLAGVGMLSMPAFARQPAPPIEIEVWKSPTCGCCKDWVAHMEANGFRVKVHDVGNTAARARLGLAEKFGSCHTARVGRYAIEGHVPAQDVLRLLKQRPQGLGLAVPGMPVGSPGMDGPAYGSRKDPHDVLLVAADGSSSIFSSYFKR